jgi:glutamate racemase
MHIGVFDSGVGGKSVAIYLEKVFPNYKIEFVSDSKNVPYGNKSYDDILMLTSLSVKKLINDECDIIVIACNTATAVAIDWLRLKYPEKTFIGCEPMVKTAASITKSKLVTVLGTKTTINSQKYKNLKEKYGQGILFIEPDCSSWASMIEDDEIDDKQISKVITDQIEKGSDVIVLACTHYHWIEPMIKELVKDRATVLNPSSAIAKRIKSIVKNKKIF